LGGDESDNRRSLVDAEVVEDHDVAWCELRAEHLADVGRENLHIGRTLEEEGGIDPVPSQGSDEGRSLPMAMGDGPDATPALQAAPIEPGHLRIESRLVDEDQAPGIPLGLLAAPELAGGRNVRPVLLGSARRFF
jgi:hypothetical protein